MSGRNSSKIVLADNSLADLPVEPTINAAAYRQIRDDIVTCVLMPNERLRVESLRDRYGLGGTPIREALMRLEAENLVVLEQNKGFHVAPVSRERLLDLTRTRIEIEGIALRWAIENGGVDWEANLLAAFHRLSRLKKTEQAQAKRINTAWFHEHRNFHAALVEDCGSPITKRIRANLFVETERYVALSIMSFAPTRNDIKEHELIMRAALARNVKRAIRLQDVHIQRTADKVSKSLNGLGWAFSGTARKAVA